jgi:hypothetical protein
MNQFQLYFQLGLEHIADLTAFDHILFIIALCVIYHWTDWKRIVILVTAFTIGHSVTLALATLDLVKFDEELIEFLIPLTIIVTAGYNILKPDPPKANIHVNYVFALIFGLIHGLGFSNYLRSLLGKESSIVKPLFAFNVGLEVGQLIIVAVYLIISGILIKALRIQKQKMTLVVSAIVLGMSLMLLLEAKFW